MISIYKTDQQSGELMLIDAPERNCWIQLVAPDDSEIEQIAGLTAIPETMLKTALDEEETAHVDKDEDVTMVVIDTPIIEEEEDWYVYTTIPLGILYTKDYFVTVCLRDTSLIREFTNLRVKNFATYKQNKFLLQILYYNAIKFLQQLRQIDRTSQRVQTELHKSMKNKELIQLLDLEKSLVYFSTSLRANDVVLTKVGKFEQIKKYEEDLDLLDDVAIENRQAIEMCNIYRDILSGTMDAFASIISNNVNLVMKMLTLITIVLSIPTLIASFWGMNVDVPFAGFPAAFWIIVAVTLVITVVVAILLFNRTKNIRK